MWKRPILVSRDRRSKWLCAHVVRRKGDDPYTIKRISQEVGNFRIREANF